MNLFDEKHIVLECLMDDVEMYQVKMFYFQQIEGLIPFRFSMSQNKGYFYYPKAKGIPLCEAIEGMSSEVVYKLLLKILDIVEESKDYLMYEENIILDPKWIFVDQSEEDMDIDMIYIPLKSKGHRYDVTHGKEFLDLIGGHMSRRSDMEGFYHMITIQDKLSSGEDDKLYTLMSQFVNHLCVQ